MTPGRIWWLSTRAHRRGHHWLARALKLVNFTVFHAVLPYECEVAPDVVLWHRGLGTVISPNTSVGRNVVIGHGVTIATGTLEDDSRVVLEDWVQIGANACVIARRGGSLRIGSGSVVGAGTVITRDVPPESRAMGPVAQVSPKRYPDGR